MKLIISMFLSVFLLQPKAAIENSILKNQKDIIEFSASWNFTGRCEGLCNVYVGGTKTIRAVNGVLLKDGETVEVFVKCPTKIRLRKGIQYKFLAEKFVLNSCTTVIDTLKNTRRFCLIEQVK